MNYEIKQWSICALSGLISASLAYGIRSYALNSTKVLRPRKMRSVTQVDLF